MKLPDEIKRILNGLSASDLQVFNTKNTVGDFMATIYNDGKVQIDYCPHWEYVEIFGLNLDDYDEFVREEDYWIFRKDK